MPMPTQETLPNQAMKCFHIAAMLVCVLIASCHEAPMSPGIDVWVAIEDHGDKPGVEYRVSTSASGHLTLEMWIFAEGPDGKVSERAKYPINIVKSDQSSVTFEYQNGQQKTNATMITFSKGLTKEIEPAVLADLPSKREINLVFRRTRP